MLNASKCWGMGIVYDSHGRGRAALEGNLISLKPDSPKKFKEFLPLGFTTVWVAPDGVPKGLR